MISKPHKNNPYPVFFAALGANRGWAVSRNKKGEHKKPRKAPRPGTFRPPPLREGTRVPSGRGQNPAA